VELRHLRYVIALAEELHFGRAARRLNMSQPPLSQQIRSLEEELGVKLFSRTKRQVMLTEAGIRFVDEARQVLAQVQHAAKVASRASSGEIGYLTVGTVTAEKTVLVDTLRAFAHRYPDVHVELRSMSTVAQLEAVREGRLQVGFVILPVEESSLAVEPVVREPLVVALPENHRLASRRKIPLKALAGEGSILFPRAISPGYYDQIISVCRNAGFSLKIIHEMDNIYTALALVEAGLGVSLFPASIQDLRRRGVVFRELEAPVPKMECAVIYRRETQSAVVQSFLNVVRNVSGRSRSIKVAAFAPAKPHAIN
jgi:DNA-binding transcriptional LysR family regulator